MAKGKVSAGILLYRRTGSGLEILLVHPGGPFWAKRDDGAWTIPKGELADGEEALAAALREFVEETGFALEGEAHDLGVVRQAAGKLVQGFAVEGDCRPDQLTSNMFEIEWPPRSGKRSKFPEIDKAAWFSVEAAKRKINPAQFDFVIALRRLLETSLTGNTEALAE